MDGSVPDSEWDWYFTMQHYGLPTRLLDWTSSSLVALYFAVRENNRRSPAAVWAIDPWRLNRCVLDREEILLAPDEELEEYLFEPYLGRDLPASPVALVPVHISKRVVAQSSCFTVFGSVSNGLEQLFIKRNPIRLHKILIDPKSFSSIRTDLMTCGITETAVFPDVEALSRELRGWWGR